MEVLLKDIINFINSEFKHVLYEDNSVNGLQVEAKETVSKIGASVDFSYSLVNQSVIRNIDLLITHHGLLWGKQTAITGQFGKNIKSLIDEKINLIGIHLPLDAHKKYGNNFIIADKLLNLSNLTPAISFGNQKIGWMGENAKKIDLTEISNIFKSVTGAIKEPLVLPFGPKVPKKICVVSGSAADALYQFENEDFDTLITGEPRQFAFHFCKENKINAIFAGHYATETFGVKALSEHLAKIFNLEWEFIDEPTGI